MTTQFFQGESSTSSRWKYDVFLSFRGKDTRKNFTGHLYSRLIQLGIRTFIDDEKLRKGDVISSELEKAIEDSRISIVVFSKNYASSSWCLDELVKIIECKDKLNQVVLPIFYNVDPSQVRNQIGYFGKPLARRRKRFGAQRMEKWKAALTQAANLSGWDLQNVANGHESRCIDVIIKQVLQKVNQTPLDVAWYPVGVDSGVKDIELLLQSDCADEVRMVGIYGIGGIGKTTLAKAIYNQILRHFDSSCFLSNVRLEDEAFGLVKLQERFLQQILKTDDFKVNSVDEGIKLIKERLCSKRVLVILDDLDSRRQLESLARQRSWFGSGSLIIITTRDEQLLLGLRANERYKAKLLNDLMAQQLFSCHAFNNIFPPQEYVKLAQDIIKYSGGLPLALVTLGSHLRGRSVEEWKYEFAKLKAIPHSDIQKILKISFDSLDVDTQSVFLDIAYAFHRFPMKEVTKTLNACGYYSESAIATLVRKCLLQRDGYFLRMHDLVRDMGREIVRMESPQNPEKRSRLFISKEVHDVLQGNKGSEKVEVRMAVIDPRLKGVNLSSEAFETMKNLRVLIMDELHTSEGFERLPEELRWLSWQRCPLTYIPFKFPADKLVVLNLRGSNIQEFDLNMQCLRSLKVLDLSFCKDLRKIRDFNALPSLEALRLACCSSLTDIDSSIGNLDSLVLLNLFRCHKLTNLPSSICKLKSLQSLNISECSSIQTLPPELGDMLSLQTLLARYTGIKQLPASIEKLIQLVTLEVGGRNLEAKRSFSERKFHLLPAFISRLSLTYCDFSEADIPGFIGSLSSLRYLNLSGNSFQHLPFNFSKLRCLWTLRLNDCENLQTLPSVSNLENLMAFEIANCKKLKNVTGLEKLSAIRWINIG